MNGVCVARRTWPKPASRRIRASRASPAWAPSTCVPSSEIACARRSQVEPVWKIRPSGLRFSSIRSEAKGSTSISVLAGLAMMARKRRCAPERVSRPPLRLTGLFVLAVLAFAVRVKGADVAMAGHILHIPRLGLAGAVFTAFCLTASTAAPSAVRTEALARSRRTSPAARR
ncbi:hypothetical protein [Amaricoccus solimangrovi]|uniref:Uncharacterized protein n=1 Tax=Amaricoccus solimangrovi TaxID=2589815 RepID=A0A501WAP1_9RHOB|nr:hypothetical protein [Amaricoccus solimangrovi]TPE46699.1 hypothetical protein FJM51_21490 [Amaricoccus solimangrovi]